MLQDVEAVHHTVVQHQHLLNALTNLLGIPEEEVQMIMNAPTYPPRADYAGPTVDVKRVQAVLGVRSSGSREPITRSNQAVSDLFASTQTRRDALLPPAIVAFSRPPPQIPNPSADISNDRSPTTSKYNLPSESGHAVLGWEPRPGHESSTPAVSIKPAAAAAAGAVTDEGGMGCRPSRAIPKKADSTVLVTAPPSEIEYYDHPRPKDLSVLALAHEVFIIPAIAAKRQAGGGPNNVSFHGPYGLSSPDLGSSPASTSSSRPASTFGLGVPFSRTFSPLSLGSSSASTSSSQPSPSLGSGVPQAASPFSSISLSPSILPFISPQIVLRYLPTQLWATAFMQEFDILMITHDGIGGRYSMLKKRIELMFEWANESVWIQAQNPLGLRLLQQTAKESARYRVEGAKGGLFAVACAVYALGALSYESTPSNLFNLARAALLVHDESALPPSLDYLHAHMLTWLFQLHPSDSASRVTSCGFRGSSTGVGSGGMTVVEQRIYNELGKCVSVARAMGLDLVDQPSAKRMGGAFESCRANGLEDREERMGIWEKEMRRRVWWQLMMFDQQISENLGRPPHIPPGTYACEPPSEVNGWRSVFGPTSTTIPKPSATLPDLHTTYFVAKCQLLSIIKTLSYAQLEGDLTLDQAKQLDGRVSSWRTALPAEYKIDFRETLEDSLFPMPDIPQIQACDLHIMANVFLLRLWLPFFNKALSSPSRSSQGVLLTATTAANAIIISSHHLVTKFRDRRPMSFGHYDFGNSVWLATGILASVATMKSGEIFSSAARSGVKIAGALFRNQVVEGKLDSDHVPKYEVNEIMDHIARLVDEAGKDGPDAGSKRKLDEAVDRMKMQHGCPIPYVGTAALASDADIVMPQAHDDDPPQATSTVLRSSVNQHDGATSRNSSDRASHLRAPQSTKARGRIFPGIHNRRTLPFGARPTSSISSGYVPSDSSYSRAHAPASDVSSIEDSPSSHSPRNPTYTLPSSEPIAHSIPSCSNRPSTVQPPTIRQLSPLNPIFRQNPPSQNVPQFHGSSSKSDSENSFASGGLSYPPLRVPPDTNPNPISQGAWAFTSTPYPPNGQVQLPPNGALDDTDSRTQSSSIEPYGTSAPVFPQTDLGAASLQVDAGFTDLPSPGGPARQPESYGPVACSGSHLSAHGSLGGPDIYEMLPSSTEELFDAQAASSSRLPPIMEEEPETKSRSISPPILLPLPQI
ncbi:hypothetical protein FRC01_002310 [Tulasnella sp. 417]|nr:hypothetical protein FRC01_002310 [Tulasnella sp. 417]